MSINFNVTVFTSPSADAGLSPALLALIQNIAALNGVAPVQVPQTQPAVLRPFAAAAGSHSADAISAAWRHGRDDNSLRRTLFEGTRYFSAPPRPIGQPRAPARAEDLSTQAQPTVRPEQEAMSTARRPGAALREPPENTQRPAAVPPQAAPRRERSKAVSPSPPAEPARKRKLRDGTPAPPPANPKPAPPTSRRDPSVSSGPPPPKPPAGPTLYSHSGKKRFTEEARAWFDAYWRWFLVKGKAEGRLPPLGEASKLIYKHSRDAGLDMCGPNAFKQYHSYYKESRMADIEMDVLGRQYCGGEELPQPPPSSSKRTEDPEDDSENDEPPRKKRKNQHKERQSTRIRLTDEERRHMVYRMGYDSQKGGRIKRVWPAMSLKFPERGFSEDQWEEAYQQNRLEIDQAVAAARPSVGVKSEGS